jgi:ring-1,2-phenylacetyl-CoA epoxidase subunit PaaB
MVFQQEGPGKPLVHNGSVHAPDIEMALMNARDVFSRRPDAVAMWVVPVEAIFTRTKEEWESEQVDQQTSKPAAPASSVIARGPQANEAISRPELEIFIVFGKLSEQAQASLLGEVEADSAEAALERAVEQFAGKQVLRWWVFPATAVLASAPTDADPMFGPAREKTYKDQAAYPVVTMMREIRAKNRKERG